LAHVLANQYEKSKFKYTDTDSLLAAMRRQRKAELAKARAKDDKMSGSKKKG
jgi:hypothetical protein